MSSIVLWMGVLLVTFAAVSEAFVRCGPGGCYMMDWGWKNDKRDDGDVVFMPNAEAYEKALQSRGRFGFGLGKRKRSAEAVPLLGGPFGPGAVDGKDLVPALFPTFLVVDPEGGQGAAVRRRAVDEEEVNSKPELMKKAI